MTHAHLAALEKGRYIPRFDDMLSLSAVLNVPLYHFEDKLKLDMISTASPTETRNWEELMKLGRETMQTGNYDGALQFYRSAQTLAESESGRNGRWAESKLFVANCIRRMGLLRIAKDELEELFTCTRLDAALKVRAKMVMGDMYRYQKNNEFARLILEDAYRQSRGLQNPLIAGKVSNSLANLYADLGRFDEAVNLYREALKSFGAVNDSRAVIISEIALGQCLAEMDGIEGSFEAVHIIESALRKAEKEGFRREVALACTTLAKISFQSGDYEASVSYADEARKIAQEEEFPEVLFQNLFYLWKIARRQKKTRLESLYFKRLCYIGKKIETVTPELEEFNHLRTAGKRVKR
ncbi:tetratricopeptide repeat protein [Acidobacteriota bacterium]